MGERWQHYAKERKREKKKWTRIKTKAKSKQQRGSDSKCCKTTQKTKAGSRGELAMHEFPGKARWTKPVRTTHIHDLKHTASAQSLLLGKAQAGGGAASTRRVAQTTSSQAKAVSKRARLKEFQPPPPSSLSSLDSAITGSCHATLHLTSWLNCFTGLDPGLSTLDGILTWITNKNRLSRETEAVSMHTHFAFLPNGRSREKASSVISFNCTDVRNKGKESRVKSNFNTQKKREYLFRFPVCLSLLRRTDHQQQVPEWQLPSLEGSESVLAQEAATDQSRCTLQGHG